MRVSEPMPQELQMVGSIAVGELETKFWSSAGTLSTPEPCFPGLSQLFVYDWKSKEIILITYI